MSAARRIRLALPAAALGLAVALAACGGDDDGDSGGSTEGSEPRETSGGEPMGPADEGVEGVEAFRVPSANHTEEDLAYDRRPPVGGDHNPVPATCGFYDSDPPPEETIVHSLEHGAVWIAYGPDLPDDQVATLRELAGSEAKVLVTADPDLDSPLVVTAWARQLPLDSADDPRLQAFIDRYRAAGESPEPDAACQGDGTPAVASPAG